MIGRLAGLRGRVSSGWLASAIAAAYVLVSVALGVALLTVADDARGDTVPAASTPPPGWGRVTSTTAPTGPPVDTSDQSRAPAASPPATTSRTPPTVSAPAGFQRVTGPAGVRTVIPAGWSPERTTGPGAMQATDPRDTGRYVKYGGSPAPQAAIDSTHVRYENDFAARATDYRRITLSLATYGGHDAVEWEFEHREGANVAHVRSLYWRANGTEYFVLAAAPADQWAQMKPVYDTMVAHADP